MVLLTALLVGARRTYPNVPKDRVVIAGVLDHLVTEAWVYNGETMPDPEAHLPFFIQLKQCNLDQLKQRFDRITNPESNEYRKYMTSDEIDDFISCGESTRAAHREIKTWLSSFGILDEHLVVRNNFIKVSAPIKAIESMFIVTMYSHQHKPSGANLIRPRGLVTIPQHLERHIDFITGLTEFLLPIKSSIIAGQRKFDNGPIKPVVAPIFSNLTDPSVIPRLLRALYGVRDNLHSTNKNNRQAVTAFDDFFYGDDLCSVHELFGRPLAEGTDTYLTAPVIDYYGPLTGKENGESSLDTQYMTLMAPGVTTEFHNHPAGQWILTWVQEAVAQTDETGPWVWSVSYGWPEIAQCDDILHPVLCSGLGHDWRRYIDRSEIEFMKLGMMGVSVLVSSGDDGAPGFSIGCPVDPRYSNVIVKESQCKQLDDPASCDCGSIAIDFNDGEEICFLPQGVAWTVNPLVPDSIGASCGFLRQGPELEKVREAVSISLSEMMVVSEENNWCQNYFNGANVGFASNCSCADIVPVHGKVQLSSLSLKFTISGFNRQGKYKSAPAFLPDYPASSQYVLSVGATQIIPSLEGVCNTGEIISVSDKTKNEMPVSGKIGFYDAGGGFSSRWARPEWQKEEVSEYLEQKHLLPPADYFNDSNRGFPDVSFNGHKYMIVLNDTMKHLDGTSASAPALAALISLLNEVLLNNGHKTLGFLPPLFYKMAREDPETFTKIHAHEISLSSRFAENNPQLGNKLDIGDNRCSRYGCCKHGFRSTQGKGRWDAVTGLGTPNFERIEAYIRKMAGIEPVHVELARNLPVSSTAPTPIWLVAVFTFFLGSICAAVVFMVVSRRGFNPISNPLMH